jgi:hypothetical protein
MLLPRTMYSSPPPPPTSPPYQQTSSTRDAIRQAVPISWRAPNGTCSPTSRKRRQKQRQQWQRQQWQTHSADQGPGPAPGPSTAAGPQGGARASTCPVPRDDPRHACWGEKGRLFSAASQNTPANRHHLASAGRYRIPGRSVQRMLLNAPTNGNHNTIAIPLMTAAGSLGASWMPACLQRTPTLAGPPQACCAGAGRTGALPACSPARPPCSTRGLPAPAAAKSDYSCAVHSSAHGTACPARHAACCCRGQGPASLHRCHPRALGQAARAAGRTLLRTAPPAPRAHTCWPRPGRPPLLQRPPRPGLRASCAHVCAAAACCRPHGPAPQTLTSSIFLTAS